MADEFCAAENEMLIRCIIKFTDYNDHNTFIASMTPLRIDATSKPTADSVATNDYHNQ